MVDVCTVEQVARFDGESTVAYRAVFVSSLQGFGFLYLPEFTERLLFTSILLVLALLLLFHYLLNVRQQGRKQLLRRLNVLVNVLDGVEHFKPLSRHVFKVALADPFEFPANEALLQRFGSWLAPTSLDGGVEAIPLKMAAGERLHFDDHLHQKPKLASRECLLVIVLLAADRTGFQLSTLGLYPFQGLEALAMEDV